MSRHVLKFEDFVENGIVTCRCLMAGRGGCGLGNCFTFIEILEKEREKGEGGVERTEQRHLGNADKNKILSTLNKK